MADLYETQYRAPNGETVTLKSDHPLTDPAEAHQIYQQQQAQTSGPPRVTGMPEVPGTSPFAKMSQYLKEQVVEPAAEIGKTVATGLTPPALRSKVGLPEQVELPSVGTMAKVGAAIAFPEATVGSIIGGTLGTAADFPGSQILGEVVGGGIGAAKNIKELIPKLFKTKEKQIEKFTQEFLSTPQALKEEVNKVLPGFKDQPFTFSKQLQEPLARDVDSLYEIARKTNVAVPTDQIRNSLQNQLTQLGKLSPPEIAETIRDTIKDVPSVTDGYAHLMKVTSDIEGRAKAIEKANPSAAYAIRQIKNGIVDVMDRYSKVGRLATSLKRQDSLAVKIIGNLRSGNVKEVEKQLLEHPEDIHRFGWDSPEKVDAALKMIRKIKAMPTQGALMAGLQRLGGSGLLAYALHRGIFDFVFSGHGRGGVGE